MTDTAETTCASCQATIRDCLLICRDDTGHVRTDTIAVDPTEVPKPAATVVRITVRPDRVWIVTPVERLAEMPLPLASLTRAFFRVHVCPTPPSVWVESEALTAAGAR